MVAAGSRTLLRSSAYVHLVHTCIWLLPCGFCFSWRKRAGARKIDPRDVTRHENACGLQRCCKMVAGRWVVRLGRLEIRDKHHPAHTHLFPTFQPSTAGTLFQYFALVFRILAAFPWRLVLGLVIHMTPRHYKRYNSHSSVKPKDRTTCACENRLPLALHLNSISV